VPTGELSPKSPRASPGHGADFARTPRFFVNNSPLFILITMHFRTLSRFLFMSLCSFFSCSTPEGLSSLSAGEFSTLLSQKPDLILLDVRTPSEYAEGHLPKSVNVDVLAPDFEQRAEAVLSKQRSVALYCRSGHRSKQAATLLSRKGIQVYELSTGWLGWVEAALPTAR